MNEMEKNNKTFEDIKHINEDGNEFWYAREFHFVGIDKMVQIGSGAERQQTDYNFIQRKVIRWKM